MCARQQAGNQQRTFPERPRSRSRTASNVGVSSRSIQHRAAVISHLSCKAAEIGTLNVANERE